MTKQKPNQKPIPKKVQAQFAAWRKIRKSRGPIPETLWDAAISLAGSYSIHQISKELRLNYTALKDRVKASRNAIPKKAPQATFVELPPLIQPVPIEEFSLDLENEVGAKMRIHVKGHTGIDLLVLTQTFWSQRP